jgi:NAD+ synthase
MMILFDEAKKREALVVGTENKSEHYLGYFTRFGDEASDLEPLRNVYKTQVYELANYLEVPEPILTKAPTAGLWEGQTDEGELGVTYTKIDQVLEVLIDKNKDPHELLSDIPDSTINKVIALVEKNIFKRRVPFVR